MGNGEKVYRGQKGYGKADTVPEREEESAQNGYTSRYNKLFGG